MTSGERAAYRRGRRAGVAAAESLSLSQGASSARYVQQNGSDSERSSITMTRRTAPRNLLLMKIPCDANSAAMPVCLGTDTVRNVPIGERNSRIGNVAGGLTKKRKVCRSNVALLCSENRRSWHRKPRKDLANLAKVYHR
jgi:hypothetical protein